MLAALRAAALLGTSGSHALHRAQPQLRACALPHGSVRTLRRCSSWNARCPSRYLRFEIPPRCAIGFQRGEFELNFVAEREGFEPFEQRWR